jgi:hypothetical protein
LPTRVILLNDMMRNLSVSSGTLKKLDGDTTRGTIGGQAGLFRIQKASYRVCARISARLTAFSFTASTNR